MTFADDAQQASELALAHFRESFLLCFRTMTDGIPQQKMAEARQIIRFFETETDAAVWARLKVDAPQVAQDWLQQWEQLAQAVGKEPPPKEAPTQFAPQPLAAGGY
jgi:hypothetical protein